MPTETNVQGDALRLTWATLKTTETVMNNGGQWAAVGGWWLVAVCSWRLVADGGDWRLVVGGGWRLAVSD